MIVYSLPHLIEYSAKLRGITSQIGTPPPTPQDITQINNNRYSFSHYFQLLSTTITMLENNTIFTNALTSLETEFHEYNTLIDPIIDGDTTQTGVHLFNEGTRLVESVHTLYLFALDQIQLNLNGRAKLQSRTILINYITFILSLLLTITSLIYTYQRLKQNRLEQKLKQDNLACIESLQEKLHFVKHLKEICDVSLSFIANHYHAVNGILYIFNNKNNQLDLGSSYGLNSTVLQHHILPGEGTLGQNFLDPKVVISHVQESTEPSVVNLGIINTQIKLLLTFPLINNESAVGNIQLVLIKEATIDHDLLDKLSSLIANHICRFTKSEEINRYLSLINQHVITSSTNEKGIITEASQALVNISGYEKKDLIGNSHGILRHPDMPKELFQDLWRTISRGNSWHGEIKNLNQNGNSYWVDVTITPNTDLYGNISGYTAIHQDITNKKKVEEISITDGLTKIFNRRHFDTSFPLELKNSIRHKVSLAFALMDIDHFKQYNDSYGHQEGDNCLILVAKTLQDSMQRPRDLLFRLGGEEFGIIYRADTSENAKAFVEKIKDAVETLKIPHEGNRSSPYVTLSIGLIFTSANTTSTPQELYKIADDMLYKAKESGRNNVQMKIVE